MYTWVNKVWLDAKIGITKLTSRHIFPNSLKSSHRSKCSSLLSCISNSWMERKIFLVCTQMTYNNYTFPGAQLSIPFIYTLITYVLQHTIEEFVTGEDMGKERSYWQHDTK